MGYRRSDVQMGAVARVVVAAALAGAGILALVGCTGGSAPAGGSTASPTAAASASASATASSPTASPTTTPISTPDAAGTSPQQEGEPLGCEQLVDPQVVESMLAAGAVADPLWPNDTANYGTLHQRFVEFGGVSCRWGVPQSDNVHIYSYAPATAQQSALLESELAAEGYTSEPRADGLVYIAPYNPGTFILITPDAVFETNGSERFDELLPYRA